MVGAQWSAKSSAGNTILKKEAFSVCPRKTTEYSEVSYSVVSNRRLTVVDSPGWFYNHTLCDTCEMDVFEIKNSMNMCPPGPHVILLVVGLSSAFTASNQKALQEHMSLFSEDVWKHTIVLFTRGDWLGSKTVEERIESEEGLVWLVEECENRYHVLNNKNGDEKQVTELLDKIEEMWAGNEATHYNVDPGQAEQMETLKKSGKKKAKKIDPSTCALCETSSSLAAHVLFSLLFCVSNKQWALPHRNVSHVFQTNHNTHSGCQFIQLFIVNVGKEEELKHSDGLNVREMC